MLDEEEKVGIIKQERMKERARILSFNTCE